MKIFRMRFGRLAIVSLCLAGFPAWAAEPAALAGALPELKLTACEKPPVIDGALDDACWKTAAVVTNFHIFGANKMTAHQAWLTYDNQWLYVASAVRHPQPGQIKPKVLEHDGHVAGDDDVEVFFDPGSNGDVYFHFLLNAANTRAEQRMMKQGAQRDRSWDAPWRSAAKITGTGWNAEMAVPLTVMAGYGDFAQARLNLGIATYEPELDPFGVIVKVNQQLASWAPVILSFHEPGHFGWLRDLKPDKVVVPFLPAFRETRIGRYDLKAGRYNYPVSLKLRNYSTTPGTVDLAVVDQPGTGQISETKQTIALKSDEIQSLTVPVPVTTFMDRRVRVMLKDPASGEILQSEPVLDTAALDLMSAYVDRNYYTTEDTATVACTLGLPAEDLKGMALAVRDMGGKPLGEVTGPASVTRVPFPIKDLALGVHTARVELCRAGGEVVFSRNVALVKKAPRPGLEWKIDRINRIVLNNGQPFFPFGLIMGALREADVQLVSGMGFKSCLSWTYIPATKYAPYLTTEDLLAVFEKYRLYHVDAIEHHVPAEGNFIDWYLKYLQPNSPLFQKLPEAERQTAFEARIARKMAVVRAAVETESHSPWQMGYMNIDEPPAGVERIAGDYYQLIQEADGYRPVFFNCGLYDEACDIIGADPYWTPASIDALRSTPASAVRYFYGARPFGHRNYDRDGKALHRPVWMVPFGEYWSGCHKRAILPQEQYCQTYLLLIHGAKGLFYFCYPFAHQASYDAMGKLAGEMETLGPIAVTPDLPQSVTYSPGEMDPAQNKFPDVHVNLRTNPAGGYVMLAANSKYYPVDTTFQVSLLNKTGAVGRLFSGATYSVTNGAFSDRIEGYGVRAYTVSREQLAVNRESQNQSPAVGLPPSVPVQISVTMTAHEELAQAEAPEIPRRGRPDKKNIVPNPSFEEASLAGWPDYFRVYPRGQWPVGPYLGRPDSPARLDPTEPYDGKVSVQLTIDKSSDFERYPASAARVYCYLAPWLERPESYTLSVYLRADQPGSRARFICKGDAGYGASYFGKNEFALTTQWARYAETDVLRPGIDEYTWIGVSIAGEGHAWIDALQLEKGAAATTFEP